MLRQLTQLLRGLTHQVGNIVNASFEGLTPRGSIRTVARLGFHSRIKREDVKALMKRNVLVALVALSMFMVTPAFAQGTLGCKTGLFIGTYTNLNTIPDIWGDESGVLNQTISQLTLHIDGTVSVEDTSARLLMLSAGTFSQQTGSWKCRFSDGKLVVTLIWANYFPTTDAINHPSSVPNPPPVDLVVGQHIRGTLLFSVTDLNTLTLTQSRSRVYDPTQDPTSPTGGVLGTLHTRAAVYKRLVASDADLLAP